MTQRRVLLRAICSCALAGGAPRLFAQTSPLLNRTGRSPADLWRRAASAAERATGMSASVTGSLDRLTAEVAHMLEQIEKFKQIASTLGTEIGQLRAKKDELLEEYRKGLFCSGCGRTKSQILAKGETFPHPGQRILTPTPQQIAAKEAELQAPIDSATRKLRDAENEVRKNNDRSIAGLEQIRLGVLFWRAASSYAEYSQAAGAGAALKELELQGKDIERSLAAAKRGLASARTPDAVAQARSEVQIWERLQVRHKADLEEVQQGIRTAKPQVAMKVNDERSRIQGFVTRGKLFARAAGPHAVLIYPSASDPEMGATYQMGRIPEAGSWFTPMASVSDFVGDYRKFGGEYGLASAALAQSAVRDPGGVVLPARPAPAPAQPAPTGSKLLQALP